MLRGAFVLWNVSFVDVERGLARRLQENAHYPFQVQQPNVYVMEYYKDTLWKGALIFLLCVLGGIFYFKTEKSFQDYSGFFVYGSLVGFWLLLSALHKRHLVINHNRGCYQIYIKRRLWEEGPLHQIYVRLWAQQDAYGKLFYSLIINGYGLEVLALASLSDKYEQMAFLGRQIARKLNLNYFDYLDVSGRHVIRHWPPPEDRQLQV
ncbi:cation channel sperm-associated auxiliary subunit TMEM249 [Emydura macquarii macquarii]|uniref:cation channel sperm-associated auxiliary subunit TMEM249 n=1 Tax=Emydura macquarii macquarii TaxID=1129001 RepID=UPI00352ADFDF